jgi:hopanoid C-2 methylase
MHAIKNRTTHDAIERKRILVVNCYFDCSHRPLHRAFKIPQAVGPIYLAGAFSRELCDVRCYTELASGPLEDEQLLSWPDMLVLTGLTNSFDRMLHLTAYVRSKNEKVIVVAGGPPVRALPRLAARFFDYACISDIEELQDVVADAFGAAYVAEQILPRYDLGYWLGSTGYAETTRYCNFRCTFCSLTGEHRSYQSYNLDYIRQQILALGKRNRIIFIDNNFYGNDRSDFSSRVGLIKEMHQTGQFKHWAALVTNDFFSKRENVRLVKDAGCEFLFSGVESFDSEWLRKVNKLQNSGSAQMELIMECLKMGVVFSYGLLADFTTRTIDDFQRELEFILSTPEVTLPSYVTVPIPILGTPYFYDSLAQGRILPNVKLRDMDGTTVLERPLDPISKLVKFLAEDVVQTFNGYRLRVLWHSGLFARIYRRDLTKTQLIFATGSSLMQCAHGLSLSLRRLRRLGRDAPRTHISSTEPLDHVYTPAFRLDARFERYFRPTMVTDQNGQMHDDLIDSGLLGKQGNANSFIVS